MLAAADPSGAPTLKMRRLIRSVGGIGEANCIRRQRGGGGGFSSRARSGAAYMGGAPVRANFGWASFLFGAMCHPPEPALGRAMWLERLNKLPLYIEPWVRHQWRDAYWKHGSVCEDYGAIQCPVFAVGGWSARESRGPAVRCASR